MNALQEATTVIAMQYVQIQLVVSYAPVILGIMEVVQLVMVTISFFLSFQFPFF